jgi:hypothetical protein
MPANVASPDRKLLPRSLFFDVDQSRPNPVADIGDRFEKHEIKARDGHEGDGGGRPMVRAHPRHRRREGDDAKQTEENDDGVEAGALPIAAAEMEPHPEFVEGQRHAEAVKQRADFAHPLARLSGEDEQSANGGEKEDSVIEMMHMGSAEVQKQIRHASCHDQNDEHARGDEGEQKSCESDAGEMAD